MMFGRLLCCYTVSFYIHFRGLLPCDEISLHAKFTLRPSLAFSYIGSVTPRHSSSGVSKTLRRGTRNGITELLRHVCSAGRPLCWASAHSVLRYVNEHIIWEFKQVLSSSRHWRPFGDNRSTRLKKVGAVSSPYFFRGTGSPSNTMWLELRPTFVPNGIFIHLAVWWH